MRGEGDVQADAGVLLYDDTRYGQLPPDPRHPAVDAAEPRLERFTPAAVVAHRVTSSGFVDSAVDRRDLPHPVATVAVLHLHHVVVRPVQVVADEGHLLG